MNISERTNQPMAPYRTSEQLKNLELSEELEKEAQRIYEKPIEQDALVCALFNEMLKLRSDVVNLKREILRRAQDERKHYLKY